MPKEIFNNIYDLDYYDASQQSIYIGDVLVEEITSIQYSLQQSKTPIYGYASQLFDDTSAGQVIVSGSFTINFKEAGYLWAVLRRYFNVSAIEAGVSGAKKDSQLLTVREGSVRTMPDLVNTTGDRVMSNGTRISRASIERMAQGEATRQERFNFYQGLASYATFDVKNPRDKVFEDIVEAFEDEIWNPSVTNTGLNSQIRRSDDNKFDGFDIYQVFGNYAIPTANHTTVKIIGVRLTSLGRRVAVGTGPIQEEYTFLARSLV